MVETRIVLLPGLDGTGTLFRRFLAAAPSHVSLIPFTLPPEALSYESLAVDVARRLPDDEPPIVIAESFSGPLAVALAQRRPVAAVVFVNSFVMAPRSRVWRWLAVSAIFRLPLPRFLVRRYLVGASAEDGLVGEVAEAVASVPAYVLAARVRSVLDVDARETFGRCAMPMLYVRGTEDRLVPDSALSRMTAIRQMSSTPVPGPHFLLQANPAGAWNAILAFLESLPAV